MIHPIKTLIPVALLAFGIGAGGLSTLNAAPADGATASGDRHPRLRQLVKHRAAVRAKVARRLDFSQEQIAQLKAGRAQTAESLKAIRNDANLTREQKRAKARETLQAARQQFRGMLTPEQQAKIDQFRAQRKNKRQGSI